MVHENWRNMVHENWRNIISKRTGKKAVLDQMLWNSELNQHDYYVRLYPNTDDKTTVILNAVEFTDEWKRDK